MHKRVVGEKRRDLHEREHETPDLQGFLGEAHTGFEPVLPP
jgi:hypothetical protein